MADYPFSPEFCSTLQDLVTVHHQAYPVLPPRDIFFEDLVQRAFWKTDHKDMVKPSAGRSKQDLTVEGIPISLKSETGDGTKEKLITITKLTTAEKGISGSASVVARVMEHLSKYELMLMLRAIHPSPTKLHYQLVDIPVPLLRLVSGVTLLPSGNSLVAPVTANGQTVFILSFDGTDRKCVIRGLRLDACKLLAEWEVEISQDEVTRIAQISETPAKKRAGGGRGGPPSSGDQQLGLF